MPSLTVSACLALLSALETGVSGHGHLQTAADNLAAPIGKKLMDHAGPLQEILDDSERREMFASISFDLLLVSDCCSRLSIAASSSAPMHMCWPQDYVFADENVNADTEATGGW